MPNYEQLKSKLFTNGFVHLPGLFSGEKAENIGKSCDEVRERPSRFHLAKESRGGQFFMDYNNWRTNKRIDAICRSPILLSAVKQLTDTKKCWLMHEDIIIKSGPSVMATPVHHDRPYFLVAGRNNISIWITASDVPRHSSLVMLRGSHKDQRLFLPKNFLTGDNREQNSGFDGEKFTPLTDDIIESFDHVDFEMKAGDAIVFFHNTLHTSRTHTASAPRKSLVIRYLTDESYLTKTYCNNVPPYERQGLQVIEGGKVPEDFFPRLF